MNQSADDLLYVEQFEEVARRNLPLPAFTFIQDAAEEKVTLTRNRQDYKWYAIRYRVLRDVSQVCLSTTILGREVSMPIGIAPTGIQKAAHHDGELATARAAASMKTLFTISTFSTVSTADINSAVPASLKWHQIYVYKNRALTEKIVKNAVDHGVEALVLTVDTPIPGNRLGIKMLPYHLPPMYSIANADLMKENDSVFSIGSLLDASLDWSVISWLKKISGLPVVVKGIITGEDATLAVKHGADAVWVSNHGGRQIDFAPSTISVLSEVVTAVQGRCEVYIDGGIRTGTQAFIALALGARAVFVGRPILWGLAYGGEAGVRRILEILRDELKTTMALAGCPNVEKITRQHVTRRSSL